MAKSEDPQRLLSEAFRRSSEGYFLVQSLRKVATVQHQSATESLQHDAEQALATLRSDEGVRDLFSDLNPYTAHILGTDPFIRRWVDNSLLAFRIGIDAASLILAHSVFDGVLDLLCRTSISVEPSAWLFYVRERTFRLHDLEKSTVDALQRRALSQFAGTLSRESVLVKIDRLFKVCKPTSEDLRGGTYRFSRDRLEKLDNLRHSLVHGTAPLDKVSLLYHIERWKNSADDIDWLGYTPMKITAVVAKHYGIKTLPPQAF